MWILSAVNANMLHHLNKRTCLMAKNVNRSWNVSRSFTSFRGQHQQLLDLIHSLLTFPLPNPGTFFQVTQKYMLNDCFEIIT